MSISKN